MPSEIVEFKRILTIYAEFQKAYLEVMGQESNATQHYFITIRPRPDTEFDVFYTRVLKFVNRKCIETYTLAFEQKNELGSGEGFHTHIVARTTHRSKGECLRDTISTFKDICAENCIEVSGTKNPNDIVNNYLLLYKSKDGHKESTRVGDEIWRKNTGLENIYENNLPTLLSIKSIDSNVVCFE